MLTIRKKIIYLDQNLFSHASKKKLLPDVSKIIDRLKDLADKQLIICPCSDTHDEETHLLPNAENQKILWESIRKISRGKRFNCKEKIKQQQMINSFIAFLEKNDSRKYKLDLSEAISLDVHDWDDSINVDIPWSITDFFGTTAISKSKRKMTESIIRILPHWRASKSSFEDDYKLEINDHARILRDTFCKLVRSENPIEQCQNDIFSMMHVLLHIDEDKMDLAERWQRVIDFLNSDYFSYIPHINISAGLYALLKKEIKIKQFLTENTKDEELIKKVRGIYFDIEHLSIFAPYCDAIFTEK